MKIVVLNLKEGENLMTYFDVKNISYYVFQNTTLELYINGNKYEITNENPVEIQKMKEKIISLTFGDLSEAVIILSENQLNLYEGDIDYESYMELLVNKGVGIEEY